MPGETSRESSQDTEVRIGWRMAGMGMEVASQVVAGAILGWVFDLWRGTGSVGLLVGSILGIAVGLWSLIKGSLKLNRELERRHPIRKPQGGWKELNDESQDDD